MQEQHTDNRRAKNNTRHAEHVLQHCLKEQHPNTAPPMLLKSQPSLLHCTSMTSNCRFALLRLTQIEKQRNADMIDGDSTGICSTQCARTAANPIHAAKPHAESMCATCTAATAAQRAGRQPANKLRRHTNLHRRCNVTTSAHTPRASRKQSNGTLGNLQPQKLQVHVVQHLQH
jgi:hypothetical protein